MSDDLEPAGPSFDAPEPIEPAEAPPAEPAEELGSPWTVDAADGLDGGGPEPLAPADWVDDGAPSDPAAVTASGVDEVDLDEGYLDEGDLTAEADDLGGAVGLPAGWADEPVELIAEDGWLASELLAAPDAGALDETPGPGAAELAEFAVALWSDAIAGTADAGGVEPSDTVGLLTAVAERAPDPDTRAAARALLELAACGGVDGGVDGAAG